MESECPVHHPGERRIARKPFGPSVLLDTQRRPKNKNNYYLQCLSSKANNDYLNLLRYLLGKIIVMALLCHSSECGCFVCVA